MIDFNTLPLDGELKKDLQELEINYVFQPIYDKNDSEIFAYEALMRPKNSTVLELIDEYAQKNKLHVLEIASLFGATMEYQKRGYDKFLCVNSFPTEMLSDEECMVLEDTFGDISKNVILEMLEYPRVSMTTWKYKQQVIHKKKMGISVDDFGVGLNDIDTVKFYDPHIVKIDRSAIAGIDTDEKKQKELEHTIKYFHDKYMYVVAEGVETEGEYIYLLTTDIDYLQGFYLSMPE